MLRINKRPDFTQQITTFTKTKRLNLSTTLLWPFVSYPPSPTVVSTATDNWRKEGPVSGDDGQAGAKL